MILLLLLSLSCADKSGTDDTSPSGATDSSPTEPEGCHYDWLGAPCAEEDYLGKAACDPCDRAWLCKATEPFPTWQRLDLSCTCIEEDGSYRAGEDCGG
ncbi:hypothetical protein L6R53_15115 [Myxococcota bacterium]|nr:hypothetical protein [Myxococcota bacterium]